MFVFPAFNNNFKQRKRTFKCCKICRNKRIRCSLSNNYENSGCDNCKINNLLCDLVSKVQTPFSDQESLLYQQEMAAEESQDEPLTISPQPARSFSHIPPNPPLVPSTFPQKITQSYLKQHFNFIITQSTPMKFLGTCDPTTVLAHYNNSLSKSSPSPKSTLPTLNACAPRPKLRKRNSTSEHSIDMKRQKLPGKGVVRNDESFEDLRRITLEANKSSNSSIGVYLSDNFNKVDSEIIKSPFLFSYLLSINAFDIGISTEHQRKMCQIFMWKINSIFPILDEKVFWEKYDQGKLSSLIFYGVVLAAARDEFGVEILRNEGITDLKKFVDELEDKMRGLLMCEVESDKLILLQIHLLLHFHTRNSETGLEKSSIDLSIVLSYAMSLGIHHKQQPINSSTPLSTKDHQAYLCKLWWVIVLLDRMNTIVNSRAMLVNKKDISIDFPKDDKNMLVLIDSSIKLEKMLSIYQPHGDKRVIPKDLDEDEEIGSPPQEQQTVKQSPPPSMCSPQTFENFNREHYVSKAMHNIRQILKNTTIILSQKRHYDDPNTPKSVPDHNNSVAASRILTIVKTQSSYLPQIPFIPYAVSLTMTIFLRIGFKKIAAEDLNLVERTHDENIRKSITTNYYDWKDSIIELDKLSSEWWFAGEMSKMGKWFFSRFENEFNVRKEKALKTRGLSSLSNVTNAEDISRKSSKKQDSNVKHGTSDAISPILEEMILEDSGIEDAANQISSENENSTTPNQATSITSLQNEAEGKFELDSMSPLTNNSALSNFNFLTRPTLNSNLSLLNLYNTMNNTPSISVANSLGAGAVDNETNGEFNESSYGTTRSNTTPDNVTFAEESTIDGHIGEESIEEDKIKKTITNSVKSNTNNGTTTTDYNFDLDNYDLYDMFNDLPNVNQILENFNLNVDFDMGDLSNFGHNVDVDVNVDVKEIR